MADRLRRHGAIWAVIGVLVVLTVAVRAPDAVGESFWADEVASGHVIAAATARDAVRRIRRESSPPVWFFTARTAHETGGSQDPHRGRTLLDCDQCHRADRWTLVRFDHDRSIFPLRGRHFTTPCRSCHTNDQYTGVRPECVSCHRADRIRADSDSRFPFHRGFGTDCGECHRAFAWRLH